MSTDMSTGKSPAIYTVPPGEPFLDRLARALLNGDLPLPHGPKPDHLALPDVTLLLPTRRAARALQDSFLSVSGARALLLPKIRPISEGEEELTLLSGLAGLTTLGAGMLDLPPAVSALERTLTLMQLVLHWRGALAKDDPDERSAGSNTPAQAAALASELAKLMDTVETENVALSNLADLVPEAYAAHWQQTVEFLRIVTEFWPIHLQQRGFTSVAGRRNALILAEAERLATLPPRDPVIVAGVTGSIPATVTLMRAVAALPQGAIVLPALDLDLDDKSWESVGQSPEHPQFGLKKLLDSLGVARGDVKVLPGPRASKALAARAAFISEALRPSATTERWHDFTASADRNEVRRALGGVTLIEAPGAPDEAEAVALILREAVDKPGRTAALVSPDRLLARRVAIRLQSWGIRVDDSAGRPFAKTVPGTFLNLVIDAAVSDFAPADLVALIKHPLCRLGLEPFDIRRFGRALELAAFRTPYLGRGLGGVAAALDHAERAKTDGERQNAAVRRLWDEDWAGARDLVSRLAAAFQPFVAVYSDNMKRPLKDFAAAHIAAAERLAALPTPSGTTAEAPVNPLWQNEAGEAANTFFVGLLDDAMPSPDISAADYADLYRNLLARENVRERTPVHPRVAIWGPFESRLQQPDILILGSLNEGTWPESADPGAWLNRPMREKLGLPSPEVDIGRSAHDFLSLLGAERVYLTRAEKIKGVPTVPSRWLMRLSALLDGMDLRDALTSDKPWLGWARARDSIDETKRIRISPPEPRPPVALRPRRLSVTRVEEWIKNPYAIFARHILKLEALPALGLPPDQSLKGGLIHEVLATFAERHPSGLPGDIDRELDAIATSVLEDYTGHPRIAAFWLPRLKRFLSWFAETEPGRRDHIARVIAETTGTLVIAAPGGPFTLTARADRIDDGDTGLIITDYKTGQAPNAKAVTGLRSPQLPLEAAIALGQSGFPKLSGRPVAALRYIRASGGEPPGEEVTIKIEDVAALAEAARVGLATLIADFDDPETPYRAVRRAGFRYDYDDYAELARVAEWSAHIEEEA
ncbi:MAG: double-strand break repair protein AddB [Hyphomicrobium sp.]